MRVALVPFRVGTSPDQVSLICQECGYSLEGLPKLVCPECGESYRAPRSPIAFNARVFRPDLVCTLVSVGLSTTMFALCVTMPGGTNSSWRDPWRAWFEAVQMAALANLVIAIIAPRIVQSARFRVLKQSSTVVLSTITLLAAWVLYPTS